jgi:predicted  nucleic acid-binding Zn-ribbon protein
VREQLVALEELAKIDLGFRQLDVEVGEINGKLDELRGDVRRIGELLDRERAQLAEAEQLRAATVREVEDLAERTARSTNRHNLARNNREKEATARELEVMRREREERVAKVSELETVVSQVRESLARHEVDFAKLQEVLVAEETEAKARTAEIDVRRNALEEVRKGVTVKVRADLLRKYNTIREKKGTAVAEISGGICRACHISMPPQLYAKLHAGNEIIQCPNCHRILVLRTNTGSGV